MANYIEVSARKARRMGFTPYDDPSGYYKVEGGKLLFNQMLISGEMALEVSATNEPISRAIDFATVAQPARYRAIYHALKENCKKQ